MILALLVIALLLWLAVKMGSFALDILQMRDGGYGEHDPQFAEDAEIVTPPPELTGEPESIREFKDNSANWDISVQTPVDQTAEELEAEARADG